MDIRFLLILAVVAAIMEILGRLARRGAGTGAPRVPGPDGGDPLMQQLEELEWVPGAHDDEDDTPGPRRERAALEVPAAQAVPERVREPEPLPPEPPTAPVPRQPRPAATPRQPPPAPERVMLLRDRAPRPVPVRSREPRRVEVRPVEPRLVAPPRVKPRPDEQVAAASVGRAGGAGGRLGLGTVGGLRRLVVAREVLGPPIALRDEERETQDG